MLFQVCIDEKRLKISEKRYFSKSAGAGAKCDHFKLDVRTRVRAHLNLDKRRACVRPKKRSQLPCCFKNEWTLVKIVFTHWFIKKNCIHNRFFNSHAN